jgi:hypothetical protein
MYTYIILVNGKQVAKANSADLDKTLDKVGSLYFQQTVTIDFIPQGLEEYSDYDL